MTTKFVVVYIVKITQNETTELLNYFSYEKIIRHVKSQNLTLVFWKIVNFYLPSPFSLPTKYYYYQLLQCKQSMYHHPRQFHEKICTERFFLNSVLYLKTKRRPQQNMVAIKIYLCLKRRTVHLLRAVRRSGRLPACL